MRAPSRGTYWSDRCARAAWQAAHRKRKAAVSRRAQRRSEEAPVDRRQDRINIDYCVGVEGMVWAVLGWLVRLFD